MRALLAEKARRSLTEFVRQGWNVLEPGTPLVWNWHIAAICSHIQAALEGWAARQADPDAPTPFQNLLINVPPGMGKSRIVSVFTPAWAWLRWPAWRGIFLSSNPRVALRDSVYCREVLESDWYRSSFRPAWSFAEDQNAKGLYRNTAGGYRQAMGFTARITGDRADALFVDDPHDAEEVNSEASRNEVRERWDLAIANRLNDLRSSIRVGIMQRVHDDDWSGHVLKGGGWAHLLIREEFEPGDDAPTGIGWRDPRTEPGELLFPERFPRRVLDEELRRLGSFGYAGQHQQRPVPADGGHFKRSWFRYWRREGDYLRLYGPDRRPHKLVRLPECRRFGIVDLAFSQKKTADYTVITAWAVDHEANLILLDVHRDRLEGHELEPQIEAMGERWALLYTGVEEVAAQSLVVNGLRRKGHAVRGLKADKDKVARAVPAVIRMEAGQIYLPYDSPELGALEAELLSFPNGSHDDLVDCVAYAAVEVLRHGKGPNPPEPPEAVAARERAAAEAAKKHVYSQGWV